MSARDPLARSARVEGSSCLWPSWGGVCGVCGGLIDSCYAGSQYRYDEWHYQRLTPMLCTPSSFFSNRFLPNSAPR